MVGSYPAITLHDRSRPILQHESFRHESSLLIERGVEVDICSPRGGKVVWDPYSDPYFKDSTEPDDLVSKGFLSDKTLVAKLDATLRLRDVNLDIYDAVHVAGGRGATFDLYPNDDVARALEHFWARNKVVGAICHGAIALGNVPDRIRGRRVTGYTLEGDHDLQRLFGSGFLIPHYPQGRSLVADGSAQARQFPARFRWIRTGEGRSIRRERHAQAVGRFRNYPFESQDWFCDHQCARLPNAARKWSRVLGVDLEFRWRNINPERLDESGGCADRDATFGGDFKGAEGRGLQIRRPDDRIRLDAGRRTGQRSCQFVLSLPQSAAAGFESSSNWRRIARTRAF